MEVRMLPKFDYYLDESDPDLTVLRRQDGSFVAAFSAQGATKEGIVEAAKEDYGELIRAQAVSVGRGEEGRRRAEGCRRPPEEDGGAADEVRRPRAAEPEEDEEVDVRRVRECAR